MSGTGKIIAIAKSIGASENVIGKEVERQLPGEVDSWLDEHITNPDSPPLDRSLTSSSSAAPADMVGELKSALEICERDIDEISNPKKNLFDKDNVNVIDGYINGSAIAWSNTAKTIYIQCNANTTYTVSKTSATKRFSIAYTTAIPSYESTLYETKTYNNNTSISITTGASAKYLVAFIYLSTADTLTFEQICAMLQIEVGSTATAYEPYQLIADDVIAREHINKLETLPVIQSEVVAPSYGSEMIASLASMTAIGGATYSDGTWTLPGNGGISTSLTVEANKPYVIAVGAIFGTSGATDGSTNYRVNPLTITLGDDNISIFANGDANWRVVLTPSTAGSVTFSIQCSEYLTMQLNSMSVKKVLNYADVSMYINNNPVYVGQNNVLGQNYSMAFGGGLTSLVGGTDTAFGFQAQRDMKTGYWNTAFGYRTQMELTTGCANVALGNQAQLHLTTGMFNNGVGTVTQGNMTSGSWNNAFGNEAQRDTTTGCNNTSMGRRAHSYLTTGNMNVAIGSFSGFSTPGHADYATTTADGQTLVGGETVQASSEPQDYVTAIGFRAKANEKALALGAYASAEGEKSIAIGYDVRARYDHYVCIGDDDSVIWLAGKKITFNQDGTVTWSNS